MRSNLWAMSVLSLAVAVAPACATKKFVRTEVGNVNSKVDTLNGSLEETQQRTTRNEERIAAVDGKAEAAGKSAQDARSAADAASKSATQVNGRVDKVGADLQATNAELAANRKLLFEVTLNEEQGKFKFGHADLPEEAKARLDQVVEQLKTETKNVFIEIEGHTDNQGDAIANQQLGLERAESVKRYLYEQHHVPLHKMNVISYGEEKPVAPNKDRDGRAQNRRVVVKVLS